MSEASTEYKASPAAETLAESAKIDLTFVIGSGNDGLITKADVTRVLEKRKALATPVVMPGVEETIEEPNVFDKLSADLEQPEVAASTPEASEQLIVDANDEDLHRLVADMRRELNSLKEAHAELIDRDRYSSDLTDDMFYLCRPKGLKWEEKRIRNKRTVMVKFTATAFFGPFDDKEMIETYLTEKRSKRDDSYLSWQNLSVRTGRDARVVAAAEKQERDLMYQTDVSTNVLDRRVFKDAIADNSELPTGKLVGPAA